ncbi:MAG: DNA processing protein [Myxococcota bacterium]|jgi:DNA processing protein
MLNTEVTARLALLHAASGDTRTLRKVIHDYKSGLGAIADAGLRARLRTMIGSSAVLELVNQELALAESIGARWLTPEDADFPDPLRATDCPLICIRGDWPTGPILAIVGPRQADDYGRNMAATLARAVVGIGVNVISGAALGVDQAAHEATVEAGGRTIAVLGEGLCARRPAEKVAALTRYAEAGAVISERLCNADGARWTYTDRNRLIAQASQATVVIQAAERSGSLNTATHATRANKPLFALPGDVCYTLSAGTNRLIRDGKARPLIHAGDLAEVFENAEGLRSAAWPMGERGQAAPSAGVGLGIPATPGERVMQLLRGQPAQTFDELSALTEDLSIPLAELLLDLELKGQVKRVDGSRFAAA